MLLALLACAAPEEEPLTPEERLDAVLPGLADAVRRYTDALEPVADVVEPADPRLTRLLLPAPVAPDVEDLAGEHSDVDLLRAAVRLDGTTLSGSVTGAGVGRAGGWLLVDGRDGPAPDLFLGFGEGWIRFAPVDGWTFGPESALAGTSSVTSDSVSSAGDTVTFTVDLAATGRIAPGHAGAITAIVRSADRRVWDFGPGGVTALPDTHAVATLVALLEPEADADPVDAAADPDLAVAVALAFGGWRGLVAPEVRPVVEADARDRFTYGLALDGWLAEQGADWSFATVPGPGKLLWAWPSAQGAVYGALPVAFEQNALSLLRYRFHVPDTDTLTTLRDDLPLLGTAWDTAVARDDLVWAELDYRAAEAGMAALCEADALDTQTCFRWARDQESRATLGEVDGVAIALDKGTSVALQLAVREERGMFVGDCATATALTMAAYQAVGLVPLGLGYAGPSWAWPTHDLPLYLEGDRFYSPQATPRAKWHPYDTFVYVTVPALDPARGTPLGSEPDGWARGGSVAGGSVTYGALDRLVGEGVPLSTAFGWTEDARTGAWPEIR